MMHANVELPFRAAPSCAPCPSDSRPGLHWSEECDGMEWQSQQDLYRRPERPHAPPTAAESLWQPGSKNGSRQNQLIADTTTPGAGRQLLEYPKEAMKQFPGRACAA